ncbi:MAG: TIR domain-containing protein [Chloroflexi bacterium]|nr:TIR domain-containing protein [Chloroflexota bacterium]
MAHIYLSYSNQDSELIDLIEDDLQGRGYALWRDTAHIGRDEDWQSAIQQAIADAHTVIVAASQQSVVSDTVNREIMTAVSQQIGVVVVLLDSCTLPQNLRIVASEVVSFMGVYQAGAEQSGLEQLRQYRQAMNKLIEALDKVYPVRIYLQDLKSSDDVVRENAAERLGELGDLSAVEALIQVLTDPDSDVRYIATRSLGKLRSESALRPLFRLLEKDEDPDVQAVAAISLGELQISTAIAPLMEQLEHSDRFVRAGVLQALGELNASAAVSRINHIMRNDPISDVRAAAQVALCKIDDPQAQRALQRAGVECEGMNG